MPKTKLNSNSEYLMRYIARHSPLGITRLEVLPVDAPYGITMVTLRGLERRGFVREDHRIFYATDLGEQWVKDNPQ